MSNVDENYENFLKSLQEDNSSSLESFPFNEDFDIENFIKTTETPMQEPVHMPAQNTPVQAAVKQPLPTAEQINNSNENMPSLLNESERQVNFETGEDKNYSIKRLEEKLSDLQQRFNEANDAKEEESAFAAELNKEDEYETQTEPTKSDEEFFSNISSAIQTLKGSLDNIVNTRLRYEENLIRQDQTLITRLKEKTNRLKAINLALNSEVKRSRSEKLEYLRRSAEQTKELLSLRMQLSHAEERTKQGDFKVSGLEQQITLLTQEKNLVDEEISRIRQEKLTYLQNSAEQTRNIMQLRHQLAAKEEALKQEEVKVNFLEQQLKSVEAAHQALQREKQNSEIQKSETEKTLLLQKEEINSLINQLARSKDELLQKSENATNLRQQLLNLQLFPEQNKNDIAAFAVRQEEILTPLKLSQQEYEQKIASLRTEQSAELQLLRTKALQQETALREELQRTEAKYRQEEGFVNSLKAQIENLENNLRSLEKENSDYKNTSENLIKEINSIKENNQNELNNLKETLKKAQNSYEKQQELFNNLETQYKNVQREKYYLSEEIKKIIIQKDNALLQNERYLSEIETLKNTQNNITDDLKAEIQELLASKDKITQELNTLKQNPGINLNQVQQTKNNLQENNNALEILKTQMATLITSKDNIDKALLEAREEKLKLLNKLDEQTKQLNDFQINYQNELLALTREKANEKLEAERKIKDLEDKLRIDQETITSLNKLIQKANSGLYAINSDDDRLNKEIKKTQELTQELEKAKKVFNQDTFLLEEIKTQYAELRDRNEILVQELVKAKEENEQIKQERRNYKLQVEELNKQLNEVKTELLKGQEFTKQLSEQLNKLRDVNITLNNALKEMQQQKIEALNTTVKQTQEILELKAQLKQLQTDAKSLNFNQGTVSVNSEHQAKIQSLEEELRKVSAVCLTQTKEINDIKTDNQRLKTVAEEKLLLQNRFNALQRSVILMTEQLKAYKDNVKTNALTKVKATALTVQLERVTKEKENLKQQLEAAKIELQQAAEREKKTSEELNNMRKALKQNEDNIAKLKNEITPLTQKISAEAKSAQNTSEITKDEEFWGDTMMKAFEDTETYEEYPTNSEDLEKKPNSSETKEDNSSNKTQNIAEEHSSEADSQNKQIAEEEYDEGTEFLEKTIPVQTIEEIDISEPEIDIESLFNDDEISKDDIDLPTEEGDITVEEIRPTDVNEIRQKANTHDQKIKQDLNILPSENTFTDHSIRRSVINRRPYVRNPITSFRKDEEYSDFLKKTKSLFYRIKWSLFKD
ncbi:MAG: hypothetical protein J5594_04475 [Elusimicrobiaceae bacterium]|nr:hypothetical protein [Elusimicrobiaceae bacterium]